MPYIPVKDAKSENLSARRPIDGKSTKFDGKYKRMYYQYKFAIQTKDGQIKEEISEPLFEMVCDLNTKYSKVGNRPKANCTNINQEDLLGCAELDKARYRSIQQFGNDLDEADFDAGNPKGIKGLFFYPTDEVTRQPTGAPAIVSLKIDTYGKSKFRYPSGQSEDGSIQFTDVPWEEIMNKSIKGIVVFHLRDDYKSTDKRPLVQAFVRSCIILSISEKGEVDPTKSSTALSYLSSQPDALSDVASQMEIHRTRVTASLLAGGEKMTPGTEVSTQGQPGQVQGQQLQLPAPNQQTGQMVGQMNGQMPGQMSHLPQMPGQMNGQMPGQMNGQPGMISMSQMTGQMGQMMLQPGMTVPQNPMPGQLPGQMPGQMMNHPGMTNMGQMGGQMTGQMGGFALPGTGPNYGQSADLSAYLQSGGMTQHL